MSNLFFLQKVNLILILLISIASLQKLHSQCNNNLYIFGSQYTPNHVLSGVSLGDLDIAGDQLTIEAVYNCTDPFFAYTNPYKGGTLISKGADLGAKNYFLGPNDACITTTDGDRWLSTGCTSQLNKTYHVAMVYDGSTFKLYVNGFLMASAGITGNLINNNTSAFVGNDNNATPAYNDDYIGYVNELRIWNVARSQTELQTYMSTSLPNPTSQLGLQAYYVFNSLTNLQGNSAYNAVLLGDAAIGQTNPTCSNYVIDRCGIPPQLDITCNSYLSVPAIKSGVTIGDLDITGDHITVEAIFNKSKSSKNKISDIVSKHQTPSDCNYLLRDNSVEIRTRNGFYAVTAPCNATPEIQYHNALVYDGSTLKFYRNGTLINQTNASGSLITNNWPTRIGTQADLLSKLSEDFNGTINEVRIWNVARTSAEINANKDRMLSNPTTQVGLQAYYTFNSLINKQGNNAWNGVITGSASINQSIDCPYWMYFEGDGCYYPRTSFENSRIDVNNTSISKDSVISISLNPVSKVANITLYSSNNDIATIKLLSFDGKILQVTTTKLTSGQNSIIFKIEQNVKRGVYLLNVLTKRNLVGRKIFIE